MNVPSNSSRNAVMSNETEKYIEVKENNTHMLWYGKDRKVKQEWWWRQQQQQKQKRSTQKEEFIAEVILHDVKWMNL